MFKKVVVAVILVLSTLLVSCAKTKTAVEAPSYVVVNVETYMSDVSVAEAVHLAPQTGLLRHPIKNAIEQYGDNYEFSWEGTYARFSFPDAKCSFEICVGAEFEEYDWYNNYIDYNDCNIMEYLNFVPIENIIFDGDGIVLTDGIEIGMSAAEISEKLGVSEFDYKKCSMINSAHNDQGEYVQVYTTYGETDDIFYSVVFENDILASVLISTKSWHVTDDSDGGKAIIDEAFSFVAENDLASFDADDLTYKGKKYSSYYGSWFYSWIFTQGEYESFEIGVECDSPHRVYAAAESSDFEIMFWRDGQYVDPMLSFLGKWRDYNRNDYIDVKSISKEGIVVFDMYTSVNDTNELLLFENLNAVINEQPKGLDDYLYNVMVYESFGGDIHFFNDKAQSGAYGYAGDKYYLMDRFVLSCDGSVQYLPTGMGNRVGSGTLPIHIPSENLDYTQASTWGYMENFGRDDPNKENIISTGTRSGENVINNYLNTVYETTNLEYADIEYTYLYDYMFPVNNTTYGVWKSNDGKSPHYLYVDCEKKMIIKECYFNALSKHTKELIWKVDTMVDKRSCAAQKYTTPDGKITIDLENRKITKADAFVKDIAISEICYDTVRGNERFMCFSEVGARFAFNAYVLFDHTTWGATLHVVGSNIPDFDIGVYYLNAETFLLDPSIGVIAVPKEEENKKDYVNDQVNDIEKDKKVVIRDFYGKIIGYIYIEENGDKTVKDFYGKIVGYYRASTDVTTDFGGKILYRGDAASALLFNK